MIYFIFGFIVGAIGGMTVIGLLSYRAYNLGYSDALKRGDLFEQ